VAGRLADVRDVALSPGTRIGRYVVGDVIGAGASGVVYAADDASGRVALKVFAPELAADPQVRAVLLREGRRAASVEHPNIVPVLAAGEADGRAFIASRLVDGRDLGRALAEVGGRLQPERACAILGQVASALDAMHACGIVHRDVKPANVLLEETPEAERAYLCDFGIALEADMLGVVDSGLVGTVGFVAPEQIRGDRVDGRADQYSLACVLYTCLAGRPPFVGESDLAVVYSHLEEAPPRLSALRDELPAALDQVLERGLAKDPRARYASCEELLRAARAALYGRRRRRMALAGAAVAALAIAGAVAAVVPSSPAPVPDAGDIGILDPARGHVTSFSPRGFVSDLTSGPDGRMLALQPFDRRVLEIDPEHGRVVRRFRIGIDPGGAPAFAAGRIWVSDPADGVLVRIRPADGAIDRVPLPRRGLTDPSEAGNVLLARGSLWVPDGRSHVERIDPSTGRATARIRVPGAQFVVAGGEQLWILSPDLGSVFRIDPARNRVVARADIHPPLYAGAVAGGYLWVAIGPDGSVWKIAPDGRVVAAVDTGGQPHLLASDGTTVWAADDARRSIARINATTGAVRAYPVPGLASAIATRRGRVVFSTAILPRPGAALPAAGPRTIRMLMSQDWLANADPALSGPPPVAQLFYATCAKLYNHPDQEGPAGVRAVPEVATGPPSVSRDGLTYRIRVRDGYRFSPPSNEAVDAATFAHVLERDLARSMGSAYAARVFGDIVGADAYHRGRSARLSGVRASGTTLTIRLTRPSGDLAPRLATTLGCAVPRATPASNTPNGLGPIAMAGPYYLASWVPGVSALVRRNPNYAGPRPHGLDAIGYEVGVSAGDAVDRVAHGGADLDPVFAPFPYPQELMPGARAPAGARVDRPASLEMRFLLVNANRGPFRERRLRRAVGLALDRRALAALWASQPAQRLIPSPLPGSAAATRTAAPDLPSARRLVGGRRVSATLVSCRIPAPTCAQTAEMVRAQLGRVGIDLHVRLVDDPGRAGEADLLLATGTPDWADAGAAVRLLERAPGTFRDHRVGPMGGRRLARALERDGRIVVYARTAYAELASSRLGCVVHNPVVPLVDIAALCVKRRPPATR
jgi:ABC-type transport system substrate-binding protein